MAQGAETLSPAIPNDVEAMAEGVLKAACGFELRLATAESCTGGLLASLLTDVEGWSHAFERGFVAYTPEAKNELLNVPTELLAEHGAVSAPVAARMAEGALDFSQADISIAITGNAGSGSPEQEAGLVFFAVATIGMGTLVEEAHFGEGTRGAVRVACLRRSLDLLLTRITAVGTLNGTPRGAPATALTTRP